MLVCRGSSTWRSVCCGALQLRDLLRRRLRERELRARQEEIVHEVLSRLAELRQVGDHGLIRADQIAVAASAGAAARAGEARTLVLARGQRHGQVGADSRERVERLVLRAIEP